MILTAIIALPLIFFIPGYVTFNAFKVNDTEGIELTFFETVFLQILSSTVITGWIAFTLVMFGYFSLINLLIFILIIIIIIAVKFKIKFNISYPKLELNMKSLSLVLLVIMAASLFFHPFESITLQNDAVILTNNGINIGKTGSFTYVDLTYKEMPEDIRPVFYRNRGILSKEEVNNGMTEYPGFGFNINDDGIVNVEYLQLYPTWIGIFYTIFGLNSIYITSLFGLLSISCIFILGKLMGNRVLGLLSSLLLVLNYAQIFFSRYPGAEMLFQFILFSGVVTFILFDKYKNNFFGVLSALCFSQLFLIRIDAILTLPVLFLLFLIRPIWNKYKSFVYIYIFFMTLSVGYQITRNSTYIQAFLQEATSYFQNITNIFIILTIILIAALIIILIPTNQYFHKMFNRWTKSDGINRIYRLGNIYPDHLVNPVKINEMNLPILSQKCVYAFLSVKKYIHIIIPLMIVSWILYMYITIPNTAIGFKGMNLKLLGLYLSNLIVIMGIGGLLLMTTRKNKNSLLFLIITLIFSFFYINNIHNQPMVPWTFRRYITVVIPALMIGVAYFYLSITEFIANKNIARLFLIVIITLSISQSYPIFNYHEFDGITRQIEEISQEFDEASIIIFHNNVKRSDISVPLRYIFNKQTILIEDDTFNQTQIKKYKKMVSIWHDDGKKVYIVNPSNDFIRLIGPQYTLTNDYNYTLNITLIEYSNELKYVSTINKYDDVLKFYTVCKTNNQSTNL